MSVSSQEYAALADFSYGRDPSGRAVDIRGLVGKTTSIGGVEYKVAAYADKPSGYQGTVFQRVDTGEIVVAHRGTEFDRQLGKDLAIADGAMVAQRSNVQARDAIELTREAVALAQREGVKMRSNPPAVTVTGHSLGGTLAQVSAHYFGLKGETFNAYGAASLNLHNAVTGETYRLPQGGHDMVNHVMAADLVSAASPHYGEVRTYATQAQVDTLRFYGYENSRTWLDARADVPAAVAAMKGGAHDMHNFLPWDGEHRRDVSALANPETRRLAERYDPMIDKFRADVALDRGAITLLARGFRGLGEDAAHMLREPLPPGEPARREMPQRHSLQAAPDPLLPASDMRDPAHPAHPRYLQTYAGVTAVDRSMGRTPDAASEKLAAALAAVSAHLPQVSHVVLSEDRRRAFAVDTQDLHSERRQLAHVDVATAVSRPVEASTRDWQAASAEAERTRETALAMPPPAQATPAHRPSMLA